MNTHLYKPDHERLTPAHKRAVIDYLYFLLWADQSLDQALVVYFESEYLYRRKPARPIWLMKLDFLASVLRGAWGSVRCDGLAEAWLAYRCPPDQPENQSNQKGTSVLE